VKRKRNRPCDSFSPHFILYWFAAIVLNIIMTIHAFQVIAAVLFIAPLESFVSPHHGAKMGLLGVAMRTKKANRYDSVANPIHYIHGGQTSGADRASSAVVREKTSTPSPVAINGVPLTIFLKGQALESVFESIQSACRDISNLVHQASFGAQSKHLSGLHDGGGSINVQGEEQKKLDVMANDIMKLALAQAGTVTLLASEEEDEPISLSRLPTSKTPSDKTSYIVVSGLMSRAFFQQHFRRLNVAVKVTNTLTWPNCSFLNTVF
jgi:Fructose-1-6-bisphosphatase, N-terminal domain